MLQLGGGLFYRHNTGNKTLRNKAIDVFTPIINIVYSENVKLSSKTTKAIAIGE